MCIQAVALAGDMAAQILVHVVFKLFALLLGIEDFRFQAFELFCSKAFPVGQRSGGG